MRQRFWHDYSQIKEEEVPTYIKSLVVTPPWFMIAWHAIVGIMESQKQNLCKILQFQIWLLINSPRIFLKWMEPNFTKIIMTSFNHILLMCQIASPDDQSRNFWIVHLLKYTSLQGKNLQNFSSFWDHGCSRPVFRRQNNKCMHHQVAV